MWTCLFLSPFLQLWWRDEASCTIFCFLLLTLPPVVVIFGDNLKDVTHPEANASLLAGNKFIFGGVVFKLSSHIDLWQRVQRLGKWCNSGIGLRGGCLVNLKFKVVCQPREVSKASVRRGNDKVEEREIWQTRWNKGMDGALCFVHWYSYGWSKKQWTLRWGESMPLFYVAMLKIVYQGRTFCSKDKPRHCRAINEPLNTLVYGTGMCPLV